MRTRPSSGGLRIARPRESTYRGTLGTDALSMALPDLLLGVIYGFVGFLRRAHADPQPPPARRLVAVGPVARRDLPDLYGVFASYALSGVYATDTHHLVVDWLSVPAGMYFLYVVRTLYRGSATDWNRMRAPRAAKAQPAGAVIAEAPERAVVGVP